MAHGPATLADGWKQYASRWLFTTNHKILAADLWFTLPCLSGWIFNDYRAELFQPGITIKPEFSIRWPPWDWSWYLAPLCRLVGFNWLIPMMIGALDKAYRAWITWASDSTLCLCHSGSNAVYGRRRSQLRLDVLCATIYYLCTIGKLLFAIHIMGASSIMGSINIIATVMNMRALAWHMKMPLFVWTLLITAFLLVAVMPVLAGAVTMMLMDINFGTSFFDAAGGGDPVLFQHIFWFFGHPEVYIIICQPGVVSQIIPTFTQATIWLFADGLRDSCDCLPVLYRMGPPYVYCRHANCQNCTLCLPCWLRCLQVWRYLTGLLPCTKVH